MMPGAEWPATPRRPAEATSGKARSDRDAPSQQCEAEVGRRSEEKVKSTARDGAANSNQLPCVASACARVCARRFSTLLLLRGSFVSPASQAGLLKPRGVAGARADEKT
jgi:hypothetical protein